MKTTFASFGWLLLLIPFISVAGTKTLLGTANTSDQQSRELPSFYGIELSGSSDVYIRFGSKEVIRLEGDNEAIEKIETRVENGTLKIRTNKFNSGWNFHSEKVKIYITTKTLSKISISGSGSIEFINNLKTNQLNVSVSGSGNINLNAQLQSFNASVSGSGEINAIGTSQKSVIAISGSGNFNGTAFRTAYTDLKISGSANALVYTDKVLNATVSGSGNIRYTGNPEVRSQKGGSGRISRL